MNKSILTLLILSFCFIGNLRADKSCYEKLIKQGKYFLNLEKPKYKKAFEKFIAARNCWDIKKDRHNIDKLINRTTSEWTEALDEARAEAEKGKNKAVRIANLERELKEKEELEKKEALKNSTFNFSYLQVALSQQALDKNKPSDALYYAYGARDTLERYNLNEKDRPKIEIKTFVKSTFGNAVFENFKIKKLTHQKEIIDFKISKNQKRFFTLCRETTALKIWDINDTILVVDSITKAENEFIHFATFDDEGGRLLACFKNYIPQGKEKSKLWKGKNQNPITLSHDTTLIQGVFFNKNQFITIDRKGAIQIWDNNGNRLLEKKISNLPLVEIKLNKEKSKAFIRSAYKIFIIDLNSPRGRFTTLDCEDYAYGMKLSYNEDRLLTFTETGLSQIWEIADSSKTEIIQSSSVITASFHPNKNEFVTGAKSGNIKFIAFGNTKGNELALKSPPHTRTIKQVTYSPNGENILSIALDSSFHIIGKKNYQGKNIGPITSGSFSPTDSLLLLNSNDNQSQLWTTNGDLRMKMNLKQESTLNSYFLNEGTRIIIVTRNGSIITTPIPEVIYKKIQQGKIKLKEPKPEKENK